MKDKKSIRAKEWFDKAQHDLETVQIILDTSGHPDVAAVLLQQAMEKYLKGFLIGHGWKLVKTHDVKLLLDEAVNYEDQLKEFYDLATLLKGYYLEERYPLGSTEVSLDDIKKSFSAMTLFVKIIT